VVRVTQGDKSNETDLGFALILGEGPREAEDDTALI